MSDVAPRQSIPNTASGVSTPSLSVEMERNAYKEKVEHFMILVKKLQEENQTYRLRKESTETVSRLLQESKQEAVALQGKLAVADSVIRVLQSRLQSHGLSSDVFPREGEPYIPGQSKNLLDNLARENKRLRNLIRSKSGDPEEFARVQQRCDELEQVCSELRICNNNAQTKISELELVLRSSDNEKDRTINALTEDLNKLTRELNTRESQCTTLAEESRMLQNQLCDVARQCQELARRLQEQGHNNDKIIEKALKTSTQDVSESAKSLAEENKTLLQKIKDITEMNKRWQDYNNQREAYVKSLHTEIANLKKKTEELQGNAVPHETQVEMNKILDESRRLMRELDNQKITTSEVAKERDRIKQNFDVLTAQNNELKREIQQRRRQSGGLAGHEAEETINALKAQIRICTEDFESERADRQKAHEKLNRQKHETEKYKKQVDALRHELTKYRQSPHVQTSPPMQPQVSDPFYNYQVAGQHGNFSSEGLAARGPSPKQQRSPRTIDRYNVIDKYNAIDCADAINVIDSADANVDGDFCVVTVDQARPRLRSDDCDVAKTNDNYVSLNASSISSKDNESISPRNSTRNSSPGSPVEDVLKQRCSSAKSDDVTPATTKSYDILRCPNCNKAFTSDEHPELLEHMEACVD